MAKNKYINAVLTLEIIFFYINMNVITSHDVKESALLLSTCTPTATFLRSTAKLELNGERSIRLTIVWSTGMLRLLCVYWMCKFEFACEQPVELYPWTC